MGIKMPCLLNYVCRTLLKLKAILDLDSPWYGFMTLTKVVRNSISAFVINLIASSRFGKTLISITQRV